MNVMLAVLVGLQVVGGQGAGVRGQGSGVREQGTVVRGRGTVVAGNRPARPRRHTFAVARGHFLLDGKPIQLLSGEIHYARVPRAYWQQRLQMAKAMGLNAVSTYVFWNFHERAPGKFDFSTDERDLGAFLKLAQQEELWVILRPGPYVCAEWDFGGYPSYLIKDSTVVVRGRDPRFLAAEARYLKALGRVVRPYLVTHGGPVLLVQVENEYGSFGSDAKYLAATRRMFQQAGFDVPMYTADGDWAFDKAAIPGLLPAANGESNYDTLVARVNRFHAGKGPYFVSEFYPGWLDHWGEKFQRVPTRDFLPQYDSLITRGASVNLYMVHGGTNFGFWSGANYTRETPIQPDLTSYDYDAPIDEAGHATPKYYALRELLEKHWKKPLPPVPAAPPVVAVPEVQLAPAAGLFALADTAHSVKARRPLTFEELGQSAGYVLYRHTVDSATYGMLEVPGLRDFGLVFVNGERRALLDRRVGAFSTVVDVPAGGEIEILVESEGRINYGAEMVHNRKGIVAPVRLAGEVLHGWRMSRLPFGRVPAPDSAASATPVAPGVPWLYRGSFTLDSVGDTFLDLRGWGKGIVFVNGHNLGRYWNIGPQRTLYLPGPWLKAGRNEIAVFEQLNDSTTGVVRGLKEAVVDSM